MLSTGCRAASLAQFIRGFQLPRIKNERQYTAQADLTKTCSATVASATASKNHTSITRNIYTKSHDLGVRHLPCYTHSRQLSLHPCTTYKCSSPLILCGGATGLFQRKLWDGTRGIHKQGEAGSKQARREFVLSPQGLVEASPHTVQPYMKLMRIDRPIGELNLIV